MSRSNFLNNKKKWTEEDINFLMESYGETTMAYMMSHLKRSQEAIIQKYKDLMGFKSMNIAGGLLSPREIAPALGVDNRTIMDWIHRDGLKAKRLHQLRNVERKYRYFIDPVDLWRWIGEHKERINFSQVQQGIILPEPSWLEEEIKKATYCKRPTNWTREEDETAFFLWQSGINYRDIANRLGRPPRGVQRRLTVIRKRKDVEHQKTN